jgi:hypothetical protein
VEKTAFLRATRKGLFPVRAFIFGALKILHQKFDLIFEAGKFWPFSGKIRWKFPGLFQIRF